MRPPGGWRLLRLCGPWLRGGSPLCIRHLRFPAVASYTVGPDPTRPPLQPADVDPAPTGEEEPFSYEVGDEVYALPGTEDGLYYPGIIQTIQPDERTVTVLFTSLPTGDSVEKTVPFAGVSTMEGDGFVSTFMSNLILSEAEARRIPAENWAHASERAWRALFTATIATLVGFGLLAYICYRLYIRDDPEWHRKLGTRVRSALGIRPKDPTTTVPISWVELFAMLRDGEPPERVKDVVAERLVGAEGPSGTTP